MDAIQKWTNGYSYIRKYTITLYWVWLQYTEKGYIVVTKMADDLQSSEEVSTNSNTILLKTLYYNVTKLYFSC